MVIGRRKDGLDRYSASGDFERKSHERNLRLEIRPQRCIIMASAAGTVEVLCRARKGPEKGVITMLGGGYGEVSVYVNDAK